MRVLTVLGSLQRRSSNRALIELAASRPPAGMTIRSALCLDRLPPYNADIDTAAAPDAVHEWRSQLAGADAVLIASPEYGHNLPGTLKNALDWIVGSGEFVDGIVAVTCAAQGKGRGLLGLASLVQTLRAIDAAVVWSSPVIVPRASLPEEGLILDPAVARQVDQLLDTIVRAAR